ncbi:MAG: hypothetical protein F6K35_01170 [Okeania sp. SIO2H7]|nr:hypothetical protein [Okeania sp. SIO2H7]
MKLETIEESSFKHIEGIRQIIFHDRSHQFAILNLGDKLGNYGLSWRSNHTKPIIEYSPVQKLLWIGIDQQLAAICQQTGRLNLRMPLTSNIISLLFYQEITVVTTENQLLIFNPNGSIRCSKGLPDMPEEISIVCDNLLIQFLEENSFLVNLQTGKIELQKN